MEKKIIKKIKEFDKTNSDYISLKINNIDKNTLLEHLNNLTDEANFKYIEAYNQQDNSIGGLCY